MIRRLLVDAFEVFALGAFLGSVFIICLSI
jgi:hypothetical protein